MNGASTYRAERADRFPQVQSIRRKGLRPPAGPILAEPLELRVLLSGSISGTIWRDADSDGVIDSGEQLRPGWIVYLDQNRNHRRDAGEVYTTSGNGGAYSFSGLAPGNYYVAQEVKPGWEQTYPAGTSARAGLPTSTEAAKGLTFTGSRDPVYLPDRSAAAAATGPVFDDAGVPIVQVPSVPPAGAVRPGPVAPTTSQSLPLIGADRVRSDVRLAGTDGRGFSVAVLDTGIDPDHPFFGADADENGVSDRIVYQYDFADGDADASDPYNHGSNVSSIIASQDAGVGGVAPGADVIVLKVFRDSMQGEWGFVEAALQWVVANADAYNIAAVNMSLSDRGNYNSEQRLYGLDDELAALAAINVIVVSGAGNEYPAVNAPGVGYPAADPNSLGVGAVWDSDVGSASFGWGGTLAQDYTTGTDRFISISQRSTTMTEVFAPGGAVAGASAEGGVIQMTGTSQAAPHVAGAAVLAQQLATRQLGRRLTLAEFKSLLTRTGVSIRDGDDENDSVTNTGATFKRLDLKALADAIYAMGGATYPGGYKVALADGASNAGLRFGDRWLPIVPGTPRLWGPNDTGVSDTDDLTNFDNWQGGLNFTVPGVYEGAKIFLYADGQRVGSATAGPGGSVMVGTLGNLDLVDGVHRVTARQQVPDRLTSADSETLLITVDTTPPPAPRPPDLMPSSDSGMSDSDNVTNDSTPTFAISGFSGAPYYRVVRLDGTLVGRAYETASPFIADQQPDGDWQYAAEAVDAAGNVSARSEPLPVTIDTTAWLPPDLPWPGYLDQTYYWAGKRINERPGEDQPERILVQPDGKYVVVGRADGPMPSRIGLARYLSDGRPDPTFGAGGWAFSLFQDSADVNGAALQPDGKIVVGGQSLERIDNTWYRLYALVSRYNPDGPLDTTFGDRGKLINNVGANDEMIFEVEAIGVQPDGKIVVAGWATMGTTGVARLLPDGRLDTSFGSDGLVTIDAAPGESEWVRGLSFGPGGKVVVGGVAMAGDTNVPVIMRLNPDGTPDSTFDGDGVAVLPAPAGLAAVILTMLVQPDGKVVVGGDVVPPRGGTMRALLMRVNTNGTLDDTFGAGGTVVTDLRSTTSHSLIHSISLQPDGKIVAVGDEAAWGYYTDSVVARFLPNGSLDGRFGYGQGWFVEPLNFYNTDGFFDAAILPGGKLVAVGATWSDSSFASVDHTLAWFNLWSLPKAPGLANSSDSGFSSIDNVTNDATPTIEVPVPTGQGLGYRVYRGGALVSGPFETGATWTPTQALPDGWSKFSNVAVDRAGNPTTASDTRSVKIDRSRPWPGPADFLFQTAPHRLTFAFSDDVSRSIGAADLAVQRVAANGTTSPGSAAASATYSAATNTATFSFTGVFADGNYRARIVSSGVADAAGNSLAADASVDFFFLRGDVNRDRKVTAQDAAIVSANLGRTNSTYAHGDVNYDGKVTSADADIVAANLGRSLPAPAQAGALEAELARVSGAVVATNQPGYTGGGFVDFVNPSSDFVEWTVNSAGGDRTLTFRYANGGQTDRPLELRVNGQVVAAKLSFPVTGTWANWATVTAQAALRAGANTICLTAIGSSGPNIDNLTVTAPAAPRVFQAEEATLVGATVARQNGGFTGTGYADFRNASGDYVEWSVSSASAGPSLVSIRYANGGPADRPLELRVNGVVVQPRLSFPQTGSWSSWRALTFTVSLVAGVNRLRLTAVGSGGGNIDSLTVSAAP